MHVYVQKSTRTTFPRRPSAVSGGELSQLLAPSASAPCTRTTVGEPLSRVLSDIRAPLVSLTKAASGAHGLCAPPTLADQCSDLKAAWISPENSSGCSQAAKCPPLSTSLK